ncbi:hypothetical protein Back11_46140 [Paenibacillus baekrokdamisoli]|uniref:Copper amine oxidase-like N-terminal domain-containing protein n=1 Tax=Paenibacillus baekrokdamisoli TaxID=1712516 RepID=A0A3G9JJR7_9BACL|nr:copper amine oxidase N-terminal domain-containing protein [Paenibacillus baekrokdamisoli]MBB3073300.1 hypothetical protein [Paenibacillus baekrokdamisoli]BBH23269.1 hypothetical protein Back11_46140 [Paenibacillus baekrokdamisoli]
MKTMKWLMSICLFFALTTQVSAKEIVKTPPPLTMQIDGTTLTVTPILKDGTVFIPLRGVMEHMGAKVSLFGKKILVERAGTHIVMQPGETSVSINDQLVSVTTPPIVMKGSTYVPLRFVGNALGYEVLYLPSTNQVVLRTAGNQAVIYGYVENLDGEGIQQGVVLLEDISAGITYETPVRNGFYRINVAPKAYRFSGYRDFSSDGAQKVNQQESFEVSEGQTVFYKLTPSQSGLKVTLNDPTGKPLAKATATFSTSHGAVNVNIRGGVGYLDFYEPGSYIFNYLTNEKGTVADYDIYHPFTINEAGTATSLDIIAHLPNIKGQAAGESPSVYGNVEICSKDESRPCFVQGAPGGAFSFYLPDGEYKWDNYYDSSTRQHFDVKMEISVKNEQVQSNLQWTKPIINIHGTASSNEGGPLSGGYINFYGAGKEYSAWVDKGNFNCYVPDGTYRVSYDQFFDAYFSVTLSQFVTVVDGKLNISPELLFFLS